MHNTAKTIAHVVLRANDLIGAAIGVVLGQQKEISKDLILCEIQVHKQFAWFVIGAQQLAAQRQILQYVSLGS